jgi:uncharacterized protein YndB with AHSA1/START domain
MLSEKQFTIEGGPPAPGTVVVSVEVSASAERVWQSLTDPAIVSRWFGVLSNELETGGNARLDFGDGDFFDLESIRLERPDLVQYDWRFLGIGPLDRVTWHIQPTEIGCLVMVTDSELERSYDAAMQLREGWLDFTSRLIGFHSTGGSARYDWRRELDVSIELPGAITEIWETLCAPEWQAQWLPFNSVLQSGTEVSISDDAAPGELRLVDVTWQALYHVDFQLSSADWANPTTCQVDLVPRHTKALLNVSHNGWEQISPYQAEQIRQRKRFCALWIAALRGARRIVEQTQGSTS